MSRAEQFKVSDELKSYFYEPYKLATGFRGKNKLVTTDLWDKMVETPFIFTLESALFHANEESPSFRAFVTFPVDEVYMLELCEGRVTVTKKSVQHFPSHISDFIEEGCKLGFLAGYNCKLFWSKNALGLSRDSFNWHFSYWKSLNVCDSASKLPMVHVVAPNVLAVLCDNHLIIAHVDLVEGVEGEMCLHFEIIRLLDLGLSQLGLELRQFRFDFDHGTPYFWFELDQVQDLEKKNGKKWHSSPCSFDFYKLSFE